MKSYLKLACLFLLLGAFSGCAGMIEFSKPKEFEGKKVIEDPPLSFAPLHREIDKA